MKIVDRKTFLQMPEGTVYCKMQFRKANEDEFAVSDSGWDYVFGIENPSIKGETIGKNDWYMLDLGDFYPKNGNYHDVLNDMCEHLGNEVEFEMAGQRDGRYEGGHVHFAVFSKEEVEEIIRELQQALKDGYNQ